MDDVILRIREKVKYIATIAERDFRMDNPIDLAQQLVIEIDEDILPEVLEFKSQVEVLEKENEELRKELMWKR